MQPIIMHLDMNSYFASVEQQDNVLWRGRPVGVCEHLGGIIIAASVEAKRWGIKTGTPVWEARKLYPKIILTPTRPDRYRFFNRCMVKVVSDYTSAVEVYSIDEVFADLTKACNVKKSAKCKVLSAKWVDVNPFEEAVNIAKEIKRRFKTEVGDWLRCSVGIAENKLLAKIGSDFKKPDGLVVIKPFSSVIPSDPDLFASKGLGSRGIPLSQFKGSLRSPLDAFGLGPPRLAPLVESEAGRDDMDKIIIISKSDLYNRLKLTDIPGIGRRQEKNLNQLGIKTLKDLRDFPKSHLLSRFGNIMGHHLHNIGQLQGTWKAPVHQEQEIKSMGHMYTLPREFRRPEFFMPVLYKLCEMVGRRLRRKNLMGNIIYFYCHDKDYQGFGKSIKLGDFVQDGREIFLVAADIYAGLLRGHPLGTLEFKLIGITVAGLRPYIHQLSLFGDVEKRLKAIKALDKINDKYGEFTILRAEMLPAGKAFADSIGFGRVKELG
jgi:nucleotidyltransferase/DNA polymerase involved in DNA repair